LTTVPNPPSEVEQLIAGCTRGDQTAFAGLYDLFASGVYRLCYSLLLNHHDAEDVAQDTFVYAFRNIRRFDARLSAFRTWLYTIAICRCRNLYRRSRPPLIDLSTLLQNTLPAPRSETPEAAFARSDAKAALEKALMNLTPRLREAVVLRYGHGLTYREIADIMDCPPKTAESRVRLAHDALRGMLQPAGTALLDELLSF
jgi:RNA polymerase sigma-70 factor (ECF subfamily)